MDLTGGVGENCSPPRRFGSFGNYDVRNGVFNRLIENGYDEVVSDPDAFRIRLDAHFNRLPASYGLDVNMEKVEDILLHQKLLDKAKDPEECPVYHVRVMENLGTTANGTGEEHYSGSQSTSRLASAEDEEGAPSHKRVRDGVDFEPCSKLGDLNLEKTSKDMEDRYQWDKLSRRQESVQAPIHEVIFSTIDKPKLLSQLSALLSDIGLHIREAHVFSTIDGYSLNVFMVDGWPVEDTDGLTKALGNAIARSEGLCSGSSHGRSAVGKESSEHAIYGDWEIDRRLLKIGERIASGSCGDLFRGVYFGEDVAIKLLRAEHLNASQEEEFSQEVSILREVQHINIVRFVGASTKSPHLCIVTEYMPGGSLYDYLHENHKILKLPQLLKFAIDVSKGMEYLHQNNIIHGDLKTANLLMDTDNVVKVADFGVARFQNQGGVMTAETGTYRWMAPEVINHQPYDQKADVFSFAIVLWELVTAKVPYESMTPLQAALGVGLGLRPEIPRNIHPKLLDIMQRCWETDPGKRPAFSEITIKLEKLLQEIQPCLGWEGDGENCSPPRSFGSFSNYDVRNDVFTRLIENGYDEAVSNPCAFRIRLDAHFNRLPATYVLDVNMDRVEDIVLHQMLLDKAKHPQERPVYHVRFMESLGTTAKGSGEEHYSGSLSTSRLASSAEDDKAAPSHKRVRDGVDFEPCTKLGDLNLENTSKDTEDRYHLDKLSRRQEPVQAPIHEVIFSMIDKPKLLSQLSALLSDIGLNIREAHVFSTIDGYSLDVFVVDGWPVQDIDGLRKALENAIATIEQGRTAPSNEVGLLPLPVPVQETLLQGSSKTSSWALTQFWSLHKQLVKERISGCSRVQLEELKRKATKAANKCLNNWKISLGDEADLKAAIELVKGYRTHSNSEFWIAGGRSNRHFEQMKGLALQHGLKLKWG